MRLSELEAVVESLLFIAGDAVPLASIAQTIELDKATARAIVLSLADKYEQEKRGLRIVEIEGAFQMCTAAECFEYIRNMYKSPQRQGLTQSLLELIKQKEVQIMQEKNFGEILISKYKEGGTA